MSPVWNGATSGAFARHRRHRKADHRRFPFTSAPAARPWESDRSSEGPGPGGPGALVVRELGPVKAGGFKASASRAFKGRRKRSNT